MGDAVGVPYEFQRRQDLPEATAIEMIPPSGFQRSHLRVPPGMWSDDGALTLALLHSLAEDPHLDLAKTASFMLEWLRGGKYTPDGVVFDCGITVRMGLSLFERGTQADLSGLAGVGDNGNGALMRSIACMLVPFEDEAALVSRAMRQGLCTHRHLRSQVTCALFALTCWRMAQEVSDISGAVDWALLRLEAMLGGDALAELRVVSSDRKKAAMGSGYVVDSFWSAVFAVSTTSSYKACVQAAVALGNDTDTTACVAGGMAGLMYGEAGIDEAWIAGLWGRDHALHLLEHGSWVGRT